MVSPSASEVDVQFMTCAHWAALSVWSLIVATGAAFVDENVKLSQLLHAEPSKARTYMVSEPVAAPPRIQKWARSEAETSIAVLAAQCSLVGDQKYPLLAPEPPSQN